MIRLSLLPHPVIFLANNLVLRRLCSWSCYVSDKDRCDKRRLTMNMNMNMNTHKDTVFFGLIQKRLCAYYSMLQLYSL